MPERPTYRARRCHQCRARIEDPGEHVEVRTHSGSAGVVNGVAHVHRKCLVGWATRLEVN